MRGLRETRQTIVTNTKFPSNLRGGFPDSKELRGKGCGSSQDRNKKEDSLNHGF